MKNILISLFVIMSIGLVQAADNASSLNYSLNVREAQAIADASSGVCVEVDGDGSAVTVRRSASVATVLQGDAYPVTTACTFYGFVASAPTAGDTAIIYDGNNASGTELFDVRVPANGTVSVEFPTAIAITNDIYVDVTDADVLVTLFYDT
jgi:hypothetical protein